MQCQSKRKTELINFYHEGLSRLYWIARGDSKKYEIDFWVYYDNCEFNVRYENRKCLKGWT